MQHIAAYTAASAHPQALKTGTKTDAFSAPETDAFLAPKRMLFWLRKRMPFFIAVVRTRPDHSSPPGKSMTIGQVRTITLQSHNRQWASN